MNRSRLHRAGFGFAVSILFILTVLPVSAEEPPATDAIPVTAQPVKKASFRDVSNEVGKISAIDSVELGFSLSGSARLVAVYFNDGDKVQQGELIAELDSTKARAELDMARSNLALAKSKLVRTRELLAKEPGSLSKQDADELEEAVNLANAEFKLKAAELNDYYLRAPFDGQLSSFKPSIGARLKEADPLVTLYRVDSVEIRYALGQEDFGKAASGQKVQVKVETYKDRSFEGIVTYVAPVVDESSGRVAVHASLSNPDYALAPGMFASVKQIFRENIERLLVPQNSVVAKDKERFVWVVSGDRVKKRNVTLGNNTNDGDVVVTAGLQASDMVVKTGIQNLTENARVRLVPDKPADTQEKH
ncbi:efflux RND transporter periplasmic adaptor subunit [Shewanella khirikhana]|uniref:efflux RND transporter periplasmic adaptor subunit n=1 Tax=Shewanella khirikhana TaxID=1965282 RepID=UPI0030D422B7